MDYHSMTLLELKEEAKKRKIKFYYIMRRKKLIQLLSMKTLPEEFIIEKKTLKELQVEAKQKGIEQVYKYNREQLVHLVYPASEEHDENDDGAQKHNHPQKGDAKQVWVDVLEDLVQNGT